MTASKQILKRVDELGTDRVFSISDLDLPPQWSENIRVKLGRMVKAGKLIKIGIGRYYYPRTSILGPVPPSTDELVKDLLYKDGMLVGYLTGYSIWDSMGLTSQFSSTIVIGLNRRKDPIKREGREIRFILQPNEISVHNVHLLCILDAIKYIKLIPDTTLDKSILRLNHLIAALNGNELLQLVNLSKRYQPRVRAIAGAILENIGQTDIAGKVKVTLNPLTEYRIGISRINLPTKSNWNIL